MKIKFFLVRNWVVVGLVLLSWADGAWAQTPISSEDADYLYIPIARSANPVGGAFTGASLEEMGLIPQPVVGLDGNALPLGEVAASAGQLRLRLGPGQALRLWSAQVPLSATTVHFSMNASLAGERPEQAAIALVDSTDPRHLGVSLSLGRDIQMDGQPVSFDFTSSAQSVWLLLQFVGPSAGESVITLNRLRMASGYRAIDFALGSLRVSPLKSFDQDTDGAVAMSPPTTAGASYRLLTRENHSLEPNSSALSLNTTGAQDVIQTAIPLKPTVMLSPSETHTQLYAQVYVKRLQGDSGSFALALFSGETSGGGYRDYPISSIPKDKWIKIETPVTMASDNLDNLFLILQIREGQASLAVDDVCLLSPKYSQHFWDAEILKEFPPFPSP